LVRHVLASLQVLVLSGAGCGLRVGEEAGEALTGTLGDFRLLREVGRGGMGIVYEAEQISLGRRVALKVLPFAATMDPRHLQRFQNEARAAASLHHPNIVPVYAVGCERGVHYYAMQFIDGLTLAQFLAPKSDSPAPSPDQATTAYPPLPPDKAAAETAVAAAETTAQVPRDRAEFRRIAAWGIQAAEALEHAHQLGIVHRDVKPGNLMLDGAGKLWVTDFGLARVGADAGLTLTGDLVGTLRYMSPEQALARRATVDHRTDIYSLGVTLYEVLTGRPAVEGKTREEILRQIVFAAPKAPRQRNRAIPADLETIILKAMAPEPERRYATAQELAEDLGRFLEDRPVQARRPSLSARARQWARRHPTLVGSVAVGVVAALAVLAGSVGWIARDAEGRRRETERAVTAALADAATLGEQKRWPEAISAAQRAAALLEGGDHEQLGQRVRRVLADLQMVVRLEGIRLELANITDEGDPSDALYAAAFRGYGVEVEHLSAAEAGQRLGGRPIAVELAAALDDWAWLRRDARGEGDPSWRHLLAVARVTDPDPSRSRVREAVQRQDWQAVKALVASVPPEGLPPATAVLFTRALRQGGAVPQAEGLLRQAQRRHPDDFWLNHDLALFSLAPPAASPEQQEEVIGFFRVALALRRYSPGVHLNLGNVLRDKGDVDGAMACYKEALRLKKDYADAHCNLGIALEKKGDLDGAIHAYQVALRLKKNNPVVHNNLGNALRAKGDVDGAIQAYQAALHLKKDFPEAYLCLGALLCDLKRDYDGAITAFREAIQLKKDFPKAHNNLGIALQAKGDLAGAIAAYRKAIQLKKDNPEAHHNLGSALEKKGQLEEALGEYREAIRLKKDDPAAHFNLGVALHARGDLDGAIAAYREALRLKKDYPDAHNNLGSALGKKGDLDGAIQEYQEALRLKKDYPDAHFNLGVALHARGDLDGAIKEYREVLRLKKDYAEAHCNLGLCLEDKGQFAQALESLRRGHELGSKRPSWPHPSAQWVEECEGLLKLDARLQDILSGKAQPEDAAERVTLANICLLKRLYRRAASLFEGAFAEEADLATDLKGGHRYKAACAAALAGAGKGEDAAKLDDKERVGWRKKALTWLQADLDRWKKQLKEEEASSAKAQQKFRHWLADPDLAGIREEAALAQLPEAERQQWQKLWKKVRALAPAPKQPDGKMDR
jgi:serine/threonine protein kinase/Flp pilus assembly protein TadD